MGAPDPKGAERILNAAISLWSEKGYRKMTMRELAKRSAMSASGLYAYFDSKEAIVQFLYHRINEQAIAGFRQTQGFSTGSPAAKVAAFLRMKLRLLEPHRSALPSLLQEAIDPESSLSPLSDASASLLSSNLAFFRELAGKDGADHEARLLWALHIGVIVYWLHDRSEEGRNTQLLLDEVERLSSLRTFLLSRAAKMAGGGRLLELLLAVVEPGTPPSAGEDAAVEETSVTKEADVVIVGGGPIGCVCAGFLKRLRPQTRVVVLEREATPKHKIGESTLSGFCKALRSLGIRQEVLEELFFPKNGLGFFHMTESTKTIQNAPEYILETFDETFQVERRPLDMLIMAAVRQSGVEILQGAEVDFRRSTVEASGSLLEYRIGGHPFRIAARWVVDATGPAHGMAAAKKLWTDEGVSFQSSSVWGYWKHAQALSDLSGWNGSAQFPREEYTQHFCFPEGWFWYIPLTSWEACPDANLSRAIDRLMKPGRVPRRDELTGEYGCPTQPILSFGLTLRSDRADGFDHDPTAAFEHYRERFPALRPVLQGAELLDGYYGQPALQSRRNYRGHARRAVGDGWLAVGDAAFFVDPLISPGLTGGVATAYRAAEVLTASLDRDALSEGAFEAYENYVRELHSALERDNQLVYMSFNHPKALALIQRFQEVDARRHFLAHDKEPYGPEDTNVWGILNPVYLKLQKEAWSIMRDAEASQRLPPGEQCADDYSDMVAQLERALGEYLESNRSLNPYAMTNNGF